MNDLLDTVEVIQSSSSIQREQGLPVGGIKGTVEFTGRKLKFHMR